MLKRYFKSSLLLAAAALLTAAAPGAGSREPVVITSIRMLADQLGDKVTFVGEVTLKKEGMTLYSDSVVVFYDVLTKEIREIEAKGNVVVRKEGRVALANKASYYVRDDKIVLTGDARIIENESQLGGERITLFIRDDRSIVEGGKVILYQNRIPEEKRDQ